MKEIKPNYKTGIPICSKYDCPYFNSRIEAGWGIALRCSLWNEKKYGKPSFEDKMLCYPQIDELLNEKH